MPNYVARPVTVIGLKIVATAGNAPAGCKNLVLENGTTFVAHPEHLSRFPDPGPEDYVVEQEDGTRCLKRKAVFERKYELLGDREPRTGEQTATTALARVRDQDARNAFYSRAIGLAGDEPIPESEAYLGYDVGTDDRTVGLVYNRERQALVREDEEVAPPSPYRNEATVGAGGIEDNRITVPPGAWSIGQTEPRPADEVKEQLSKKLHEVQQLALQILERG